MEPDGETVGDHVLLRLSSYKLPTAGNSFCKLLRAAILESLFVNMPRSEYMRRQMDKEMGMDRKTAINLKRNEWIHDQGITQFKMKSSNKPATYFTIKLNF